VPPLSTTPAVLLSRVPIGPPPRREFAKPTDHAPKMTSGVRHVKGAADAARRAGLPPDWRAGLAHRASWIITERCHSRPSSHPQRAAPAIRASPAGGTGRGAASDAAARTATAATAPQPLSVCRSCAKDDVRRARRQGCREDAPQRGAPRLRLAP
jgi:hypothetical protein